MSLLAPLRTTRRLTSWQYRWGSVVIFFLLTCWLYGFKFFDNSVIINGAGADMAQEVWFVGWPAFALTHGHSLFFSTWMDAPHGINMMANTSMPLLGILGLPITLLFGPVVTYTIMMRLGFILSAAAAQYVARRVGLSRPAALAAGLLYGFSTFQIVEGWGHLFLVFAPLPPLIFYAVYCLLIGRWKPYHAGLVAGGLLGADFLISAERALLTLIALAVVLVVSAVFFAVELIRTTRRFEVQLVINIAIATLWALVALVAILAWPLIEMMGRAHVSGAAHPWIQSYYTDLVAFIWPGPFTWLDPFHTRASILKITSKWENGSYIGVPLAITLAVATIRGYRNRLVVIGSIATFIIMCMSLGRYLTIDGVVHKHYHSPYNVLTTVKYVENIEPLRYMAIAWLGIGLLAGYALDRILAWRRAQSSSPHARRWRGAAVGCVVLCVVATLLPAHRYPMPSTGVPSFFTSAEATTLIPESSTVLMYPYPTLTVNHALLDQAAANYRFKLIGGEALVGGAKGANIGIEPLTPLDLPSVFIRTWDGTTSGSISPLTFFLPPLPALNAATITQFHEFISRNHVSTVIVETATSPQALLALPYLKAAFGTPLNFDAGTVLVWSTAMLDRAIDSPASTPRSN